VVDGWAILYFGILVFKKAEDDEGSDGIRSRGSDGIRGWRSDGNWLIGLEWWLGLVYDLNPSILR